MIHPLMAGPHFLPARLAKPMITGAKTNFKMKIFIEAHYMSLAGLSNRESTAGGADDVVKC